MLLGAAQQPLRRGHTTYIEVQVVLPGVPDPAVDLDAVLRRLSRRVACSRFGDGRCPRRIGVIRIEAHRSPVRRGPRAFDFEQIVGELVLYGLERSDRYAE